MAGQEYLQQEKPSHIGEIIVAKGLITPEQLDIAVRQHKRFAAIGEAIAVEDLIVNNGFATRRQISDAISDEMGDVGLAERNSTLLKVAIPQILCRRIGFRPLRKTGRKLYIAATRSLTDSEKEEIISAARANHVDIDDVVIDPRDTKETLAVLRSDITVDEEALNRKIERLNAAPDEGALVQQIIHDLLIDAVQARASDIHIDNMEDDANSWISFRVDGDLRYRYLLAPEAAKRLATRLKGDAGMDFSDRRRMQDGRFPFTYQGRQIDVRMAAMPIDSGETITMRLLDPEALLSLNDLFRDSPALMARMKALTSIRGKTGGVVIISGPTGSGKTTTLYAILRELDRHRLNVMTAEDPVEYRIPLVRQAQVFPEIGNTFSNVLRAQLRHDPDILVVGELRDSDTAETALRSAESGHFVLTTLHSADALQTVERLVGMFPEQYRGSGTYVLGHYLWAIMNQRLIKRLCQHCRVKTTMTGAEKTLSKDFAIFDMGQDEVVYLPSAEGCSHCKYMSYSGRVLLPETLFFPFDPELRHRMSQVLLSGNLVEMKSLPGVVYQSRLEAAVALLRRGVVDPELMYTATESMNRSDAPNFNIFDAEVSDGDKK